MTITNVDPEAGAAGEPLLDESPRPYPDPFYCPLTNEVMRDPVVGEDGNSFEKSAALGRDAGAGDTERTYYPNRALRAIIEKEKRRVEERDTLRGALTRAEESARSVFQQVLDKSPLPTRELRPLPDAYYCSITLDLISRAAIDPDGNSYERQAILGWIEANGASPLTREALTAGQLRDNHALDDLIDAEVRKADGAIHPSFRRWRESRIEYGDEENNPPATAPPQESDENVPTVTALPDETEDASQDGPHPYPTSQEEIDELARGKRNCTITAFLFLILFLVLAIGYIPFEVIFFVIGGVLICLGGAMKNRSESL